jgi:hypothetical protein
MRQVIHIFRKDVRQRWPEIAFVLAVLVAYAWNAASEWTLQHRLESSVRERVASLLPILLILSWCLLIVRVIQSETPVGDRQYWITRPYEWKKLLAAKLLFIAVFVNAPLLIVHLCLLPIAGFRLTPTFAPGLIWMQATFGAALILPTLALASVTATIAQMALALLAVGVYIAGAATLAAYIPSQGFSSGSDNLQAAVMIGACLAAVVWQYARRKTGKSRALLVGGVTAILILVVATPYRTLVARQYPQLGSEEQSPVQLVLDSAKPPVPNVVPDEKTDVEIQIPIRVSGIAESSLVAVDGTMLALEAQDGTRWNSGWESSRQLLFPNQQLLQTDFEIKKSFFDRVRSSTVKAHISFAMTIERDKA